MTRLIPSWRKTLVGFAMLVEVAFSEDYGDATGFGISCVCRWSNKEGRSHMIRRNLHCWGLGKAVQKDHMFVFFDVNMRPSTDEGNDPDIWADLVVFEFFPVDKQTKPSCTVRGCGVRVITDANCNTSIENILPVWSLDPMEVSGNEDEEALRISYDGLHEIDKALFNYIVGLFNDEDVGLVAPHIANIFDMDVSNGLKVLADRSLIRVSSNGEIVMPCLLRQMGNEILHTESKKIERLGDDSMANTMKTEKSKGKEVVCIMDAGSQSGEEEVESSEKSITGSPNPRYMLPDSSSNTERTINAKEVEITHSEIPENQTRDTSHVPTKRLMADTLLLVGVEKLWDLLVRDSDQFQGVEEHLNALKSDLNMLRIVLKNADAKKHTSAMRNTVEEEIKEIVYDAEDIIETFLLKEELEKKSGIKKRIRKLAFFKADRRGLAHDMEALSKRIAKVIHDLSILGDENSTQSLIERQREMRLTFPSIDEDHANVGLEKNIEQLVGYLLEEDGSQVVSITGMGGIGKTTLARQVFNHEMVKNHFDGVAWVFISQQFKETYVWQKILQQLSSKQDDQRDSNMSKEELQGKLFRVLETSNSLIVLDDIWKAEDWDRIKPAFPSKKGWKVLLTSRNENVAFHADPTCVTFKPECLTLEDSWILFRRTAFNRENVTKSKVDVEMEEMGKQMIKYCGGLPLAVKVLGGLLAYQHTLSDWKRISGNIKSFIVGGTSFNDVNMSSVYQILYLSFEELPIYLKICFLYLAHFPEGNKIDVEKLSYYWAAEGISSPRYNDGATIREVTDGYIKELVKRNMVISERDVGTSRFETLHLNDLMREVCLRKAEEENFVHIVDTRIFPVNPQSSCKSRRIAIHRLDETYDLVGKMKNLKLRSLLVFRLAEDRTTWDLLFTRLQLLRVLDLFGVKFERGKLPSSIGNLIHLRYLSLLLAEVTYLPSSMRNLRKMLYLNLNVGPGLKYMPNFLEELRELKYLCLPWGIPSKTKLKLGSLINMEMLENFSTEHSSVDDLQQMTRLTTLKIILNSKGYTTESISSSLSKLRHLEELIIYGSMNDEEGLVLDCVHLKQLKLNIYMPRLPDEQHFPSYLTTISLENCRLEEDPMPILEKLLQLKDVRLWSQSFNGKRMVCSCGGFPQLQKLELSRLEEWEEWIVEEGSMPLLHTMKIWICPKLKELPDGLRFLYSLKDLNMSEEWKERLSVGGADHDKVEHIPSVQFSVENDAQIASGLLYEERERQINHRSASQDEENEQLAEALRKSLKDKEKKFEDEQLKEDRELAERLSIMCGGCDSVVDHGRSVNVSGVLWHPRCFICHACDKPIAIHEVENHVSNSRGKFHKSCYKRYCYVCKEKKMEAYKYNQHPFWEESYCCAHETDGTPKCFSCERLEPTNNVMLGDGRWLCLECMESAVMDSDECQPLHFDIREYFEGLNMKIEKEFPFLLVEKQALNKAEVEEKIDNQHEVVTRGICLSEEQTVISVSKLPKEVVNNRLIGMARESQRVVRKCEVTAILILYGLPRLLTGYILAHEMMHAYLRLNGHRNLNKVLEEGICQMLGHMWLEAETYATVDATAAAASSSSSHTPRAGSASKKSEWSDFEKKLVGFYKYQIETDESPVYGDGFRKVNEMMKNSNIQETLKEILRRS